jgi:hypothetical protein
MEDTMTVEEKEAIETFVLRQANLTLLDRILGEDLFDRLAKERLRKEDRDYLFYLARQEEAEIRALLLNKSHTPTFTRKLDRLLKNVEAAIKILGNMNKG